MIKVIRKAMESDLIRLQTFLEKAGVSTEGVEKETIHSFLLLENTSGFLEASIGIEKLGKSGGLLRSLVIMPSLKEEEVLKLFQQVEILAVENSIEQLYLVTNKRSTVEFFSLLGFETANKEEMNEELTGSKHFVQSINMEHTAFMKKLLK